MGIKEEEFDIPIEVVQIPRGRNVGLPACKGPKLYPFRPFGNVEIESWERCVAVTNHSIVWKVKIDGISYALKLVCRRSAQNTVANSLTMHFPLSLGSRQLDLRIALGHPSNCYGR